MTTGEFQDPGAALGELRARLEAARVAMRLNKNELYIRAGLKRTTVSQALSRNAPAPTAQTVGALANALRLDARPLLDLLDVATRAREGSGSVLGKPIAHWDPHDLEVHPAADVPTGASLTSMTGPHLRLPGYVQQAARRGPGKNR